MRTLLFALLLSTLANAEALAAEATLPLATIDERGYIDVRDSKQWLIVRGEDARNPVVLIVHGGPGAAPSLFGWTPFATAGWEKRFTLAHWDQPGSGKSFVAAGNRIDPELTLDEVVSDGIAVAEYLVQRFGGSKVVLLGNSWGSIIAVGMVRKRPDLFLAYVGAAQVVNKPEDERVAYQRVIDKARARGDGVALAELEASGPPPYTSPQAFRTQRKWANAYENLPPLDVPGLARTTPGSSMADLEPWVRGLMASETHFRGDDMKGPAASTNLREGSPAFGVPMYFIQGTEDDIAPLSQVTGFVDWLRAPDKKLVTIEGAGHNAITSRPEEFLRHVIEVLEPL